MTHTNESPVFPGRFIFHERRVYISFFLIARVSGNVLCLGSPMPPVLIAELLADVITQ